MQVHSVGASVVYGTLSQDRRCGRQVQGENSALHTLRAQADGDAEAGRSCARWPRAHPWQGGSR